MPGGRKIPVSQRSRGELIGLIVVYSIAAGVIAGWIGYTLVKRSIQPLPGKEWVWAVVAIVALAAIGVPFTGAIVCWRELRRRARSI